jgi:streptogramin lyase
MGFQPVSYLTFCLSCLSVSLVLFVAQAIDGRSASYTTVEAAAQKVESIPIAGMKAFPESITSTTDGTLYVGRVGDGGIVRIKPRTAESTIFIQPGASSTRFKEQTRRFHRPAPYWFSSFANSYPGGFK